MKEAVETDASSAVFAKLGDPNLTDETLLKYIHHPEYDLRSIGDGPGHETRPADLVLPLLKSPDTAPAPGRPAGSNRHVQGLAAAGRQGDARNARTGRPDAQRPDESWWVALHAIEALGRALRT
jgi:hypothetical protein